MKHTLTIIEFIFNKLSHSPLFASWFVQIFFLSVYGYRNIIIMRKRVMNNPF